MLDLNKLQRGEPVILKERFRVRLMEKNAVPIVCDIPEFDGHPVLLIDLPEAEGYEAQVLNAQKELLRMNLEKYGDCQNTDKENIPSGCELASENLTVTFLSIEKLDKMAAANKTRMEENDFRIASLDRFMDFDLHLVPEGEGNELINELTQQKILDTDRKLNDCAVIVFTESASASRNVLFMGYRHIAEHLVVFKAQYLGDFYSSISRLERFCAIKKRQSHIVNETKCHCRYDVLRDNLVLLEEKDKGNFVPATLVIETEWELKALSTNKLQSDFLQAPPDNTTAIVKFKPGWMDGRIPLTDRINELKFLAGLATHLKMGTSPWGKQHELKEQPEIDARLKELIVGAKDKLDAQTVYPFDFTDRLWDVLKGAKSIETLRRSFQRIYEQLQTGEFRVLVESNKTSSLAKMLRVRNQDELIFPRLEPMTCLQLLVEIGVDQLNGEVAYRFVKGQFLPNNVDLEPFFIHPSAGLEARIERLFPLHLALQSMMTFEEFVRFLQHEKASLTKRLLTHFTSLKGAEAFMKEFHYTVKMEDIRREKLDGSMSVWVQENHFDRQSQDGSANGSNTNAVHISKNFGLKYLRPHPAQQDNDDKAIGSGIVKQEIISPLAQINEGMTKKGEEEDGAESKGQQLECLHLVISRVPVELFC